VEDFNKEFAVNATSSLISAQEAVKGFKELPSSASKTFIHTGNKLNTVVIPHVLVFGMGKNAVAHMIQSASVGYAGQGFK
jgi:hypothetical protein